MPWTAYIDGGSRGNPGPAAAGVHLLDDSRQPIFSAGFFLGRRTNNEAEYAGLLIALDLLSAAECREAHILSDSELLVRQMTGQYRVKSPQLIPLFQRAIDSVDDIGRCRFQHVPREQNTQADALANKAMDAVADVVILDKLNLFATLDRPRPSAGASTAPKSKTAAPSAGTAPSTRSIQVTVIKAPRPGGCPAHTRAGQTCTFTSVTPSGLCVEACATVIDAVVSLQTALREDPAPLAPMTITCSRPDCGAVFQIGCL